MDQRSRLIEGTEDVFLWQYKCDNFKKNFNAKATWQQIRIPKQKILWSKGIWFSNSTTKYSLCACLVVNNRLSTGERMRSWNVDANTSYIFCNDPLETREHLLYNCPFTSAIWNSLTQELVQAHYTSNWNQVIGLISDPSQPKQDFFFIRYVFQTSIHGIWRERNTRKNGNNSTHSVRLIQLIDKQIRNRLSSFREIAPKIKNIL